jgi:hypothetical protein
MHSSRNDVERHHKLQARKKATGPLTAPEDRPLPCKEPMITPKA